MKEDFKVNYTNIGDVDIKKQIDLGTFALKSLLARMLIGVFVGTNGFVVLLVSYLVWIDSAREPAVRLVDRQVIMTLIGATTVQVGVISVGIFTALFPRNG
jgi:hypothetical protein